MKGDDCGFLHQWEPSRCVALTRFHPRQILGFRRRLPTFLEEITLRQEACRPV